jgi:hypothetical protein
MARPIHLFVSSSPDLTAERDGVGQMTATLPLSIGWRIGHTPTPREAGRNSSDQVAGCDLYVLILGHDFAAPMGTELRQAAMVGKKPLAYRAKVTYSPAAQEAIRARDVEWQVYSGVREFLSLLRRDLTRALLRDAQALGLELSEVERLVELAGNLEAAPAGQAGQSPGDAGRSAVILGREVLREEK